MLLAFGKTMVQIKWPTRWCNFISDWNEKMLNFWSQVAKYYYLILRSISECNNFVKCYEYCVYIHEAQWTIYIGSTRGIYYIQIKKYKRQIRKYKRDSYFNKGKRLLLRTIVGHGHIWLWYQIDATWFEGASQGRKKMQRWFRIGMQWIWQAVRLAFGLRRKLIPSQN